MDTYKKAIETLKTSDIKLYVYKNQGEVIEEHQPTIFDFFSPEIFALEELNEKYETLKEKEVPKPMTLNKNAKVVSVALQEYICPSCGSDVYAHHKYCWKCGQRVKFK